MYYLEHTAEAIGSKRQYLLLFRTQVYLHTYDYASDTPEDKNDQEEDEDESETEK